MKKASENFFVGIAWGIVIFVLSGVFDTNFSMPGAEKIIDSFPDGLGEFIGTLLLGVPYALLWGLILWCCVLILKKLRQSSRAATIGSLFAFSFGVYCVFVVIAIAFLKAISTGGF